MTYAVTVTIYCDERGCRSSWERVRTNRGGLNKTMAAVMATHEGWRIPGKDPLRALCPKHRPAR